ncbi:LAME_0C00826g1_1 [Lachancea meyersii CBS 8951]|uniref:LAME_0C00826g1_1 n=1 Tax=Lachancea meyersii CBS 8951 TaxID=1266667 RepID=A0A1G4IZG7_9SACH|nr:LAME_0C00826g1_1 [Lachancea meyersii CBS 8951]
MKLLNTFKVSHLYMHVSIPQDYGLLAVICICTTVYGIIPAIISILMGLVFDLLRKPESHHFNDVNDLMHHLTLRSMAILITGVASAPVCWLSISAWMSLGERQAFRVRRKLLQSYLEKSMSWYDSNEQLSGEFTQLNRCAEEFRSSSAEASAIIFQNLVTVIALLGTAFYYSWSLTLVIIANSPLVIGFAILCSRKVEKYGKLENTETSKAAGIVAWSVNAARMIRLLGTQDTEARKFQTSVQKSRQHFNDTALFSSLNYSVLRFLTLCMFVQGFWYGNVQIRAGHLKPGDVITCFSSCILMASTLNTTLHQIITLQKGAIALRKVLDFIETPDAHNKEKLILNQPFIPVSWYGSSVVLENVTFSYPTRPNDLVLKNVSLKFTAGQLNFIVGKSGSGKSTIGNIILKLYELESGSIKVDGVDTRQIEQHSLLRNVTLVEQTTSLFNDTLRNNIQMGATVSERDEKLVKQSCQMAMLDTVVRDLAKGLDTLIGNSGTDLSGGERQRVAIARARFRDAPILILDEALSAQDRVHRSLLMEAIRRWRKGKTTIILTHELGDISKSDYVFLMDDGEVKEKGFKCDLLHCASSKFSQLSRFQDCEEDEGDVETLKGYEMSEQKLKFKDIRVDVEELYSEMGSPSTQKTCSVFEAEDLSETGNFLRNSVDLLQSNIMIPPRKKKSQAITRVDLTCIDSMNQTQASDDLEKGKTELPLLSLKQIMRKLFCHLHDGKLFFTGVLAALLAGLANPVFSYTFSRLLSGIASSAPKSKANAFSTKWSLIVLLIALLDSSFNFLKCYLLSRSSETWIKNLRISAFRSIEKQDMSWFNCDLNSTSKVSSLILNDLRDLRALASEFLAALTTLLIVSICGLVWALVSGWKLSLVCISLIPIFVVFSGFYGGLLQKRETDYKTSIAALEDHFYNAVTNIKTVRCYQFESTVIREFTTLDLSARNLGRKRAIGTGFGVAASNALTFMTQAILLYYGLKLVITGEYTSGKMLQTITLLLFTIMTCMSLISQVPEISRGQRSATYIFQILEAQDTGSHRHAAKRTSSQSLDSASPLIRIEHLRFSYHTTNTSVYRDLSIKISEGEKVAFVGRSGSGKSTLWQLMARLYPITNDSVWVDGTDINNWDAGALRTQIAVVEQQPQMFPGSLIQNLTYGLNREVSDREIEDLLELVGMRDFVRGLPDQLHAEIDTQLISGGQVQRLAIVRALLRRPMILILDECTSALDAHHSSMMSDVVKYKLQGITTLVITHSEQMMRACSRIVTFSKGAIVEDGTFEQLQRQKGELFHILSANES